MDKPNRAVDEWTDLAQSYATLSLYHFGHTKRPNYGMMKSNVDKTNTGRGGKLLLRNRRFRLAVLLAMFAVLAAALAFPIVGLTVEQSQPGTESGVLDLRKWSLERDGAVRLNGAWAFYPGQYVTTADENGGENAESPSFVKVPGEWTHAGMPGRGNATYRLRVLTSGDVGTLGLRIPAIAPAYRIYADGKEIARAGELSTQHDEGRAAYRPQTAIFTPEAEAFELSIQIENRIYPEGGIWFSLTLGSAQVMQQSEEHGDFVNMAVFGGCALLGLYQIAVFVLRRSERSTLYFGICCLLGAIRQWVVGGIYLVEVYPEVSIRVIIVLEYLTYYGGVTMAMLFVRELYPQEFDKRVVRLFAGVGCGFVATVLLLPAEWFTSLIDYFKVVSLLALAYLLGGFSLALWRGREGALLQLTGWLIFVAAAMHDILYSNGWLIWIDLQLVPYGFIILVFMEALVLAGRFTNAYRTIGAMSEQLMAMNRLKDEFLANTSHELKTPLHGILNLSQALSEGKSGPLNESQREQLTVVVAVARRMTNLINDILDLSLLKNNGIRLQLGKVDVRAVVSAQEEVFRHYIGDKPVSLRLEWPESLPYALADESRLLQIVYNLIGNAIKFTPEGEVVVSARAEGGMLQIAVSDTGIGIPVGQYEAIFQSFEQAGTAVAKEYGGAGLGLGITRRLVELHGGTISVTSTVGEGSVFTFTIPAAAGGEGAAADRDRSRIAAPKDGKASRVSIGRLETAVAAQESGVASAESREGSSITASAAKPGQAILAVDDDPVNLRVLKSVLAEEPYEVVTASSGAEALQILELSDGGIGLVILDVMMPGLSGYETCRRLREKYALTELPVLLTTVRNEPEDLMYGFEAGANDYLTKPFRPQELRARVRTLIEMKRSAEEAVRSEMAFLQAQIKPHFLYNALNTIVSLSLDEPQTSHDLLLHLSRYLRGSFDFNNKLRLVPLRKELDLTEAYLQIEQARFGDRLRVRYEIDETALSLCLLPPTTLQPLVENAVRHGVTKKEDGGIVTVKVRAEESEAVITVEDDGVGMPAPEAEILAREAEGEGGVGMRNIHQRLLRQYGRGLEIESAPGRGASVTIRVPLIGGP